MNTVFQQTAVWRDGTVSNLLRLCHNSAAEHQTVLGIGRQEMRQQGLLWMIVQQKLVIMRRPIDGECIVVTTWLSETRHGTLLRQYELTGADGAVLGRAAAVWALADAEKRTLATMPLPVPLTQRAGQLPRFSLLRPMELTQAYHFTVPGEYVDENGHMNNACYLDAVTPILPAGGVLRGIQVDYHTEAVEGETLAIGYAVRGKDLLIQAQGDRGLCCRMKWEYE